MVFPTPREFRLLILVVVVLLVLLFMPQGLAPWLRNRIETVCQRCMNRNVFWRRECGICGAALE